jgi:predicted ABC-type exoprotein transport system permease subunit
MPKPPKRPPKKPIRSNELLYEHSGAIFQSCVFIAIFVIAMPLTYVIDPPDAGKQTVFALLLLGCHVANWKTLQLRWRLWFSGGMTVSAAWLINMLLLASFVIPLILLEPFLQWTP